MSLTISSHANTQVVLNDLLARASVTDDYGWLLPPKTVPELYHYVIHVVSNFVSGPPAFVEACCGGYGRIRAEFDTVYGYYTQENNSDETALPLPESRVLMPGITGDTLVNLNLNVPSYVFSLGIRELNQRGEHQPFLMLQAVSPESTAKHLRALVDTFVHPDLMAVTEKLFSGPTNNTNCNKCGGTGKQKSSRGRLLGESLMEHMSRIACPECGGAGKMSPRRSPYFTPTVLNVLDCVLGVVNRCPVTLPHTPHDNCDGTPKGERNGPYVATLDNATMSILADALEDAGMPVETACPYCFGGGDANQSECRYCGSAGKIRNPVLFHLRSPLPHFHGCHVVKALQRLSTRPV